MCPILETSWAHTLYYPQWLFQVPNPDNAQIPQLCLEVVFLPVASPVSCFNH